MDGRSEGVLKPRVLHNKQDSMQRGGKRPVAVSTRRLLYLCASFPALELGRRALLL